jgi:hypothetical protein
MFMLINAHQMLCEYLLFMLVKALKMFRAMAAARHRSMLASCRRANNT